MKNKINTRDNNRINISATLEKLTSLGQNISWHTARHCLAVQRNRIAEVCQDAGITPIYG